MNFIRAFISVLNIFYSKGKTTCIKVACIACLGILIEIASLIFLYYVVSGLIQGMNQIIVPWLNNILPISFCILGLVAIYFLKFMFAIWQNKFFLNFCYLINYKITSKIIESYYQQSAETYKNNALADVLNKVFMIGGFFSEIIFQSVLVLCSEVFLTLILIAALLMFNYKLLLLLLVILLPVGLTLIYFSRKRLKVVSHTIMQQNVEYHQSVMTMLLGLTDVKLSGQYPHFFANFKSKIETLHSTRKIITLENSFPPKVLELTAVLGIAALFFITHWAGQDLIMAGLIAAFATATFRFIPSLNRIIASIQNLQLYKEYIQFIVNIRNPNSAFLNEELPSLSPITSLSFKDVSFAYGENQILHKLSLKLLSGQITGISGPSGVGKTTLVNIISGLLTPNEGEVFLNDKPLTPQLQKSLMLKSAYVMQDPYFLNGSIAENIVFGTNSNSNFDHIEWCISAVNLNEFIRKQPMGLHTEIGDHGAKLSGGQKQRLAIARALYRKASVLVLDEPSNALDEYNKQAILSLIKQLTEQNKLITLIVSHDQEVLRGCDFLLELKMLNE